MLRSLFSSFKNIVMAVLVGLLLVSLAIWGVSDAFTPNSRDAAAMVGKEKIKLVDFDRQFRNRLREENRERPERITTKQAYNQGLHRDVVAQMITRTLLNLDADNLGIDVNSRDALEFVESLGTFNNDITGKYDKRKLADVLSRQNTGITVKKFEEDVYNELRINQSVSGIVSGLVAPPEFGNQQYKFMTEQRKVKLLTIDQDAIIPPPDPTDEELKDYIEDNPTPYIAPEYRRFTLLRMEIVDAMKDAEATEAEIADLFDYKIKTGELGREETRSMLQFIANDEETANTVTAALNAGTFPEQIQADTGLDAPIIYTDITAEATTDPVTGEAGFELPVGTARTVEGSLGTWYSVQTTNITPAVIPDLENERETLIGEIKRNNAEKFIYDALDAVQTSLDEGETLESVARAHKVSVASYDFVSRLGENEDGEKMEGLGEFIGVAGDDKILTEIFTSEPGFEGDVIETGNKGIAAVRVDEVKQSARREFDTIRDLALTNWHLEKANEALGEYSDDVFKRINDGESVDDIAANADAGVSIREVVMMRSGRVDGVSGPLAVQIFGAREGQTVRGLADNGLDRVVAKIETIVPNEDVLAGGVAGAFKQQVENMLNDDIQQAYRKALMEEYPARSIDENIQRVLGIDSQ